jgi:hypothetical protein
MTPTADDRGGSLFKTRREAGFLFCNKDSTSFFLDGPNSRLPESAASINRNRQVKKQYHRQLQA